MLRFAKIFGAVGLPIGTFAAFSYARCESTDPFARIEAKLLIPGRGEPIEDGVVIIQGKKIVYAGTASKAPKTTTESTRKVNVLMPGMWDAHCHFLGVKNPTFDEIVKLHPTILAARCVKDAEAALNAGFTSLREVGGLGVYLQRVINEGSINGPTIYAAGSFLSMTGGHGDLHDFPLPCISDNLLISELCDGVPECLKAVRKQLRKGASLIKIHASGGVLSELDHPIHQQFSIEEMKAIVEEAKRAERIVAAHCHGKPGMIAALHAGVKTIEHGTWIDEEVVELMLQKDAILVPTRTVVELLLQDENLKRLSPASQEKAFMVKDLHKKGLQLAIKKGVKIAGGTDIFTGVGLPGNSWGKNGLEASFLVKYGMTPLQAIEAVTATGPLTLGPQAPKSGQLKEGYDADLIAVDGNPVQDIGVLAKPDHILIVWKNGKIVKDLTKKP